MIRPNLARLTGDKKLRVADVARQTGLSRTTITLLSKQTAQKIGLSALEKLCRLFNCAVGDILELTSK